MGFLDHSTNNIIVDAVLTDTGREFLAANRGDFKIAYFSLSDDEVDYTIIERFGRSVGKEKIIKNTPIFEAQTIGTIEAVSVLGLAAYIHGLIFFIYGSFGNFLKSGFLFSLNASRPS